MSDAAIQPDAEITAQVQAAGTSFYWAMRLLPPERRAAMFAIYAFCRAVDDVADEGGTPAEKQAGLAEWRAEVERLYRGAPETPIGRALLPFVAPMALRQADFVAVIDGMAMDAEADIRAPSEAELLLYCARVAGAVGRLSVRAFGDPSPAADEVADALGLALQLTNILRDVGEDAARGRLYLPRERLDAAGIAGDDPALVLADARLPEVAAALAGQARAAFARAEAAMARADRHAMRPARIMGAVYRAQLERLEADGWRDPLHPPKLGKGRKLWLALRVAVLGR